MLKMNSNNTEQIGHYVCALVDLLGQKNELKKLDEILSLQAQHSEALSIFRNTYGRVKQFRKLLSTSSEFFNTIAKPCNDSPQIKTGFFSDLVISYLSLSKNREDVDICRLSYMLISLSEVFLNMLANHIALRGGVDIGLAIESHEGQLYGNALLKAYCLESEVAQSIRIVVGQELVDLLNKASEDANSEISNQAKLSLSLIKKDYDGVYILDYLAKFFQQANTFDEMASKAKSFLESEANRLRKSCEYKTALKYEKALKYFSDSGVKN